MPISREKIKRQNFKIEYRSFIPPSANLTSYRNSAQKVQLKSSFTPTNKTSSYPENMELIAF